MYCELDSIPQAADGFLTLVETSIMSLSNLRANPKTSCERNVYRTGPMPGSFKDAGDLVEGGKCKITCTQIVTGFYDLKAQQSESGTDYFYPWLQRGVGYVCVPKGVPDGTLVITGGVNGCTLVVSELGTNYYFYHDGDSKHLKPGTVIGNQIAKVAPKDYDPFDFGQKAFIDAITQAKLSGKSLDGDVSYGYFVVAVKNAGRFAFYSTGVLSVGGLKKLPVPWGTSCITSFD